MGLIFIPLTTVTLAGLQPVEIPQGSALSNTIRQPGGTFGTAITTTCISTRSVLHILRLSDNLSIYNPLPAERIWQYRGVFLSKGDALAATAKAYRLLQDGAIKQAMVMTYADPFLMIGGFFPVCIPLLLLFIR